MLVWELLRRLRVFRLVVVSTVLFAMICQPLAAQTPAFPYRDDVVRLLEQLVVTGYPLDNEHDDGEWLQAAVRYAVHLGDREIEHLAMRAAVPLRARVDRPVSSTEGPAIIEVLSYKVLTLPRPVSYVAWLEASLDGSDFVDLGSQVSESPRTIDLRQLGPEWLRPGTHYVRLRARIVFGDPQQPFHSEVRELAPIAYALYDPWSAPAPDARWFVYSPAAFAASDLDPLLPSQPFLMWLGVTLSSRGEVADPRMWTSRYCSELTDEHHAARDGGGICTVIYFNDGGSLGQIWMRTGSVEAGVVWSAVRTPSVEALFLSDGRAASRLSALPLLLDQPYDPDRRDRTVPAPEILITPAAPKPGAAAKAVITLHNRGEVTVQNLKLEVVHLDGLTGGGMRHFVFDIPPFGSHSVTVEVSFRNGYGLVLALPFIKDHGIVQDLVGAPLDSPCVVRAVNAAAAPRDYLRTTVGHMPQCIITR